jgi:toxin ParE1/3/4
MASYSVHPDAVAEYGRAATYYLRKASARVATAFIAEMEAAIEAVRGSPTIWPIVGEPGIRRYLLSKFPYVIYYRWESEREHVAIYAIMHTSRRPGYWRYRVHRE